MALKVRYPPGVVLGLASAGLSGRRRDLGLDARRCIAGLDPPLRVEGREHVPARGPLVVVVNHYSRPGLPVWWSSMAISSVLSMPHTWIIASQWTASSRWVEPLKGAVSSFLFSRLARVYDFLRMPPMPPRPHEMEARARAVRLALAYVDAIPEAVVCLAPEGMDMPGGVLAWPPGGVGRFISLLVTRGICILPAGACEQGDRLTIRFGAPYRLMVKAQHGPSAEARADARDRLAARVVMKSIAALLPESMRGEFT